RLPLFAAHAEIFGQVDILAADAGAAADRVVGVDVHRTQAQREARVLFSGMRRCCAEQAQCQCAGNEYGNESKVVHCFRLSCCVKAKTIVGCAYCRRDRACMRCARRLKNECGEVVLQGPDSNTAAASVAIDEEMAADAEVRLGHREEVPAAAMRHSRRAEGHRLGKIPEIAATCIVKGDARCRLSLKMSHCYTFAARRGAFARFGSHFHLAGHFDVLNSVDAGRRLMLRAAVYPLAAVAVLALAFLFVGPKYAIGAAASGLAVVAGGWIAARMALGGGVQAAGSAMMRL